MNTLSLFPIPKRIQMLDGCCAVQLPLTVPSELAALETVFDGIFQTGENSAVCFSCDPDIAPEGYCLEVLSTGIRAEAANAAGWFYAMVTLGQLLEQSQTLCCCRIKDAPSLRTRAYMLDISRGRVPTMETLRGLVDLLVKFKYNQLQLYIEGFSFDYPSFPECMEGHTPLTGAELRELDHFCSQHYMELVPNQNCLGHMAPWLARPEFRHLAEQEDITLFGKKYPPTTLDASDTDSLELVKRMYEDLLPNFTSRWVNVNMDEAFELGKGKNADYAAQYGGDRLFLNYAKKLHEYFTSQDRRMMMWADAAADSALLREELPEDILMLEWGYEAEHPYEQRLQALKQAGRSFLISPGTSSWSSFTGNTDNMLKNITAAMDAGYRYGAEGMMLTEWGDMGHLQPPAVNWPGMIYAGSLAWNGEKKISESDLALALDLFAFRDQKHILGQLALDMGRYNRKEPFRMACRTIACLPIVIGPVPDGNYASAVVRVAEVLAKMAPAPVADVYLKELENRKEQDAQPILAELEAWTACLKEAAPACKNGTLIKEEYQVALESVRILTRAHDLLLRGEKDGQLASEISRLVESYRKLWPKRAKPDGLETGLGGFIRLKEYFEGGELR